MKGEKCSLIPALLPLNPPLEFATEWPSSLSLPTPAPSQSSLVSTTNSTLENSVEADVDYSHIVLKKIYRFQHIPSGFFCRLTVRLLRTVAGALYLPFISILSLSFTRGRYWRNGILVKETEEKDEIRKVLTTVDDEKMTISISAVHFSSVDLYCR